MNAHKMTPIAIITACLALAGCASTGAATPIGTQLPQPPITAVANMPPSPTARYASLDELATAYVYSQATAQAQQTIIAQTPTQIPSPTGTPLPMSPAPSNTPLPTATNYPDPAVPFSTTGPWLVYSDHPQSVSPYLWAINQDGTGLTRLINEPVFAFAVRPTSTVQGRVEIAYRTGGAIKLLSWPDRNVKTIVYGLSDKYWLGGPELEWSPSGSKLAFIGGFDADDTTSNVFVYDTAIEQSARIAVTDRDDCCLRWSPDERYVIFEAYGRTMSGYTTTGDVWSARADAGGVTYLVSEIDGQYLGYIEYLGWLSPTELIVTFWQYMLGENVSQRDIRILNIETGNYTTLVREPLLDVAYSPEHNLFLMTKEVAPAPNRLLIFYHNGEKREISGYTIKTVQWLGAYNMFLGQTPDGRAYLISPDGAVTEIPTPEWSTYDSQSVNTHYVIVSPDHQWWAWYHTRKTGGDLAASELWVGPAMAQPSIRLSYACNPIWSPDSQHLLCPSGFVASAPDFEGSTMGFSGSFWDAVWVQ